MKLNRRKMWLEKKPCPRESTGHPTAPRTHRAGRRTWEGDPRDTEVTEGCDDAGRGRFQKQVTIAVEVLFLWQIQSNPKYFFYTLVSVHNAGKHTKTVKKNVFNVLLWKKICCVVTLSLVLIQGPRWLAVWLWTSALALVGSFPSFPRGNRDITLQAVVPNQRKRLY